MSDLGFCVHGHFYQPSREDPLTGEIPEEKGAFPYKNWNELILSQCYQPNAELGNYKKISFDFGPTLLDWMDSSYPKILEDIIAQDNFNYQKYGVGNALAQPYHHTILPLASTEDKITQIYWGIQDFIHRFGHKPNGMWLPETAVDLETLDIMAGFAIEFTILAPWQADAENIDVTQPYFVQLGNGKKIDVFFYHRELSTQISFDPLSTINADVFANNFVHPIFQNHHQNGSKYILLASDGELYGHHQPFRDKFLAHLMNGSLQNKNIRLVFPALWLKENPATTEVKIRPYTSWSCHHGVKRWSTGCECTPNSGWKNHLKDFVDFVANIVNDAYVNSLSKFAIDYWDIRNKYIDVILGKILEGEFIQKHIQINGDKDLESRISVLLQSQFERQRMYTSCGWFFEDFDRIEPNNIIAYACQALNIITEITNIDYYEDVKPYLEKIVSVNSGLTGLEVFQKYYKRINKEVFTP